MLPKNSFFPYTYTGTINLPCGWYVGGAEQAIAGAMFEVGQVLVGIGLMFVSGVPRSVPDKDKGCYDYEIKYGIQITGHLVPNTKGYNRT